MQALAAAAPGNVLPLGGPKAGGKEGEVSGHLPQVANTGCGFFHLLMRIVCYSSSQTHTVRKWV